MSIPDNFPQKAQLIYLNHAAVGVWPVRTQNSVIEFAQENTKQGATDYPKWLKLENNLRELLKQLINAHSSKEIALAKSTSEALSIIAYGIDWKAGDNVVLSHSEFPSNRIVWESLKSRFGVEIRIVNTDKSNPEQQLIQACDVNTRLLTTSSVHYADGFRMDLEQLGEHCKSKDILFCVDAIQSLGALAFDAQACHADFVVADGHKWMLAAEGLALFYCREKVIDQLSLNQFGWHMIEHAGDYDREEWQPASTARRFECGSPNMLGAHAMHASLDYLINDIGINSIHDKVSRNSRYLFDLIDKNELFNLQSDTRQERISGIVNLQVKNSDQKKLYTKLMSEGLICAYRGGGIRLSPHFYQETSLLDEALEMITELSQKA